MGCNGSVWFGLGCFLFLWFIPANLIHARTLDKFSGCNTLTDCDLSAHRNNTGPIKSISTSHLAIQKYEALRSPKTLEFSLGYFSQWYTHIHCCIRIYDSRQFDVGQLARNRFFGAYMPAKPTSNQFSFRPATIAKLE